MPSTNLTEFLAKKLFNSSNSTSSKPFQSIPYTRGSKLVIPNDSDGKTYVVKVDQNVKGRFHKGLMKIGLTSGQIENWVETSVSDFYSNFIIEPCQTNIKSEIYILIRGFDDIVNICFDGGIDLNVGTNLDQILKLKITDPKPDEIKDNLWQTLKQIYNFYQSYHLTFLEINPLALIFDNDESNDLVGSYMPLDMLAKFDSDSLYLWPNEDRLLLEDNCKTECLPQELAIEELGKRTGASLKLKVINPNSNTWFLLWGGGASVAYLDHWMAKSDIKPANYGEISGNPSKELVKSYCEQLFDLMCAQRVKNISHDHLNLIIGGGISNFTDVKKTFEGVVEALNIFATKFIEANVGIYVRRGGLNYIAGLDLLSKACEKIGLKHKIVGPEIELTGILSEIPDISINKKSEPTESVVYPLVPQTERIFIQWELIRSYNFNFDTKCILYGSNLASVAQNMLDYDAALNKEHPSVNCFVDPTRKSLTNIPVHWKGKSILLPSYPTINLALKYHPNTDGMVNFSSYRSAYTSTIEALTKPEIKFVNILAEGIAERQSMELVAIAKSLSKTLIGPSSIGAIFPGKLRLGNAGGKLETLAAYNMILDNQANSVGIVTKSGGLLNELCHTVHKCGLKVGAAIAIGGDKNSGIGFPDVINYYETLPNIKQILMLGEVGGIQEIVVANFVKQGIFTKPIIGLCLGSAAALLEETIQFGHAGADAQTEIETANFKNSYMAASGLQVVSSWQDFETILKHFKPETLEVNSDAAVYTYNNKPHHVFFSSISDERTNLSYDSVPVSEITSIGSTIGHLWFKKNLPDFLIRYFEKILILCADHGPCVSGAQNTIIATRAQKDMESSVCAGLLTIGPKFGGVINESAKDFRAAMKSNMTPQEFVSKTKTILGIGHKHYSIYNPDPRVKLLKELVETDFVVKSTISYALEVEKITLMKKSNLILNIDGYIAVSMIDGLLSVGFTEDEVDEHIENGTLNGFFILARTIGLIGHHIDQKRLKQDLFRCPESNVGYL
jgi:ATP citrate (pro-S)-lyase